MRALLSTIGSRGASSPMTPERLRQLADATVAAQFDTVAQAAEGAT